MIILLPLPSFLPSLLTSILHVGCIYIRDYVIYLHPRKTPVFPVLEIRLTGQIPVHRQRSMRNIPVIYASFPDLRIFSFIRFTQLLFTLENYNFINKKVNAFKPMRNIQAEVVTHDSTSSTASDIASVIICRH